MPKLHYASTDDGHEVYAFASETMRDNQVEIHDWIPLESDRARKLAERNGRLYLWRGVDANNPPKCTLSHIHWVCDGEIYHWFGCRVAYLAVW